jgi:hypothetical protein
VTPEQDNISEELDFAQAHINYLTVEDLQEIQGTTITKIENGCEAVIGKAEVFESAYSSLEGENKMLR